VGTPTVYALPFSLSLYRPDDDPIVELKPVAIINCFNQQKIHVFFCTLDHAFSNYDERKTNEMHFQSKPYTVFSGL
jgi:hypothetical protein